MKKFVFSVLLCIILPSCGGIFDNETQLQQIVDKKVTKDLNAIGTMVAKYEAIFANYKEKAFRLDDVYIQRALYNVVYGFDVSEAIIRVEKADGDLILNVQLPPLIEIKEARSRETLEIEKRFKNYYPTDDAGNKINVSKALDIIVQKQLRVHEKRHINEARKMTLQYFQALADNYGLKLRYTMSK